MGKRNGRPTPASDQEFTDTKRSAEVEEEHVFVADRDHVVVEDPCVDGG